MTPKQRMLNAYRGLPVDTVPVAPEFWVYYPARLLGVDMIQFAREVPFHMALKQTFEAFSCEGWGIASPALPNPEVEVSGQERWLDERRLETRSTIKTPAGTVTSASLADRDEPGWPLERPIKDFTHDLPVFEVLGFPDLDLMDPTPLVRAWEEVGESYLLEGFLGVPFTDFWGGSREGGLEQTIYDFVEHEAELARLHGRYVEYMVEKTRRLCEQTPVESLFIGCSWSCNSLISPRMWRRWDKPVIAAVAAEAHRHGRLLHVHFHGRCLESVADFAEIGMDCVCPFERPPGGDVEGLAGLREVARLLDGRVTMNGNIHTVETLIRGTPADVRREVREVWEAFGATHRVIVGTGDQVGRETPEENLWAMVEEARACGSP
ncbi:uroporphyrinogen decarboxylase family protein [bacterium]|nr:uroporphyrinogen decarboxylase family protein [bacterium]